MRPEFAVIAERDISGVRVIEIDTSKAKYQGIPWATLGDYGKRKFENILILTINERAKINYV